VLQFLCYITKLKTSLLYLKASVENIATLGYLKAIEFHQLGVTCALSMKTREQFYTIWYVVLWKYEEILLATS